MHGGFSINRTVKKLKIIALIWSKHLYVQSDSFKCAAGQEKKRNTPIYFNTSYRREMKLVSIIMNDCLLKFDALMFS